MSNLNNILNRESALPVVLGSRQMSMVAFGTVISYGLVSGSAFPLLVAGAAAIPAYAAAALVALLLMASLGRLVAKHPTPGAFGSYAECYLGSTVGFMVRAAYFASLVLIIGTEVSLLAPVLTAWVPHVSADAMLVAVLAGLAIVNLLGARAFARCEVALSAFKVLALVGLIGLACYIAHGAPTPTHESAASLIVPFSNIWQAFMLAVFGFIGIESLAIVAAETKATPDALRRGIRVTSFAVVGLAFVAVVVAGALLQAGMVSLSKPPFGALLQLAGLPWPNTLLRVLILVTVLSVLNSQMYCASRMLFSMARAGQAPAGLGRVSAARGPVWAVGASGGISIVVFLVNGWLAGGVFVAATAVATTGLLFVWLAIFLSHVSHRLGRHGGARRFSKSAILSVIPAAAGALVVVAIAASILAIDEFAPTMRIGLPTLLLLWLIAALSRFMTKAKTTRFKPEAPANAGRLSAHPLIE
ncbi:amino acid permease [Achromobacter spanius]|uniref:amino acid permease n=1 Tax=Achromobacter spanius TaxID=217203 RepID=UPI0032091354